MVVSDGGVTDALIHAVELAGARNADYRDTLEKLRRHHVETIDDLLPAVVGERLRAAIERDLDDMRRRVACHDTAASSFADVLDLVSGYGEIWSAQILAAYLSVQGEPWRG